jgi:hypothetical protein
LTLSKAAIVGLETPSVPQRQRQQTNSQLTIVSTGEETIAYSQQITGQTTATKTAANNSDNRQQPANYWAKNSDKDSRKQQRQSPTASKLLGKEQRQQTAANLSQQYTLMTSRRLE